MTTANVYATRGDVYRFGLPRGTLGTPARVVASVNATSNVIELDGHGFETDDAIVFRAAEGGSLPTPLVAGTTYYAKRLTDSTFQVAATAGGSAIDLTTAGANVMVATPLPFDEVLEYYSRWADSCLPAHIVPLEKETDGRYHPLVVGIVAELAAKKLQFLAGKTSASVDASELAAKAQLERFASGVPLRSTSESPANLATTSSIVIVGSDERGWGSKVLP